MNNYFHKYKGIIIQNDDPDQMGRVKVFVPEISMTLFKEWNSDKVTDKKFTELGDNLDSSITPEILERLKNSLPWAMVEQPIFGMGTATTYHNDKNFGEIGNDADNSTQQSLTNKQNAASEPANNNFSSMSIDMGAVTSNGKKDSSTAINEYQNTAATNTQSYIQNSTNTSPVTLPTNNIKQIPSPPNGNISEVQITFTPNARNAANINRRFTTSATITTDAGNALTGQASAVGQAGTTTNVFTAPVPNSTSTSVITPITQTPTTSSSSTPVIDFSPPLHYTLRPVAADVTTSSGIDIQFIPNDRNYKNLHRRFNTSATLITFDGEYLTLSTTNGTNKSITSTVHKNQITDINIIYTTPDKPIDITTNTLGQLGNLLATYNNNASVGVVSSPITPPTTIKFKFNRGGGGGDLFALSTVSSLIPIYTMLNTLVGNVNPDSKHAVNYKRPIKNGTDPNERVGVNQQTSADCKAPMRSPTQSNKVKGMISIPAVGAHVSVYFDNGNPLFPIVSGVFYTKENMAGIHDINSGTPNTQ